VTRPALEKAIVLAMHHADVDRGFAALDLVP